MREVVIEPNWEQIKCPYCRQVIYFDNEHKRTYHQDPACRGFLRACVETHANYHGEARLRGPKAQA